MKGRVKRNSNPPYPCLPAGRLTLSRKGRGGIDSIALVYRRI